MSQSSVRMILCILLVSVLVTSMQLNPRPTQAQTASGTIAYVRAGGTSGDQIRLIEPDGSNDRALWTVPVPDPRGRLEILSLDWRPDATELAFSSDRASQLRLSLLFHGSLHDLFTMTFYPSTVLAMQ